MSNQIRRRSSIRWLCCLVVVVSLTACSDPVEKSQKFTEKGKSYLSSRDVRAAVLEFKNALQENPNNAEARFLLGKVNLEIGDVQGAEKELKHAIAGGWTDESAVVLYAETLLQQQAYQRIIDELVVKESLSTETQANLLALQAIAYSATKKETQAQAQLTKAEQIAPMARWVMQVKITQQLVKGDNQGADASITTALATYPTVHDFWLMRAQIRKQAKEFTQAEEAINKAIALDPPNMISAHGWQARMALVQLFLAQNKLTEAQTALAPLEALNAESPEVNYFGGLMAFQQQKIELAEGKLLNVVKVAPKHTPSQLLLGSIYLQKRNFEQAVYYLGAYVEATPS
ncbi:MAG: hypothetical protein FD130_685, partial [Halothiobacillaceae bacterium]